MADEFIRTHQQAYNKFETEAKGYNSSTPKKTLIEIRCRQLKEVVLYVFPLSTLTLYSGPFILQKYITRS
jgi:hypothetical protein